MAKEKQTAWNFARERREAGRADGDQAAEVRGRQESGFYQEGLSALKHSGAAEEGRKPPFGF